MVHRPPAALSKVLVDGTTASLLSAAAAAALGRFQSGHAATAINGPSQWIWGRAAAREYRTSWRHTAVGYLVHHACSLFWAGVYRDARARRLLPARSARAACVGALAGLVDYTLMPRRFTPGWEARLRPRQIALIYLAFAAGLALGERFQRAPRASRSRSARARGPTR